LKKAQKDSPQKSVRPKTFAHSNKSKKFNFLHFFVEYFFCMKSFGTFSVDSKLASAKVSGLNVAEKQQ
jgi:hypothetical protein